MKFAAAIALCALGVLAPMARSVRGDDAAQRRVAIGEIVPAFAVKDTGGREVSLASLRAVTDDSVAAAIRAAAGFDATRTWKSEDLVETVPGVRKADGTVDAAKRLAFLRAAGRDAGLLLDEGAAAKLKTLGDVAAWLKKSGAAPVVLVFWFSKCPSAKAYAGRLAALSFELGARVYPVASNSNESIEGVRLAEAESGYRVLLDPDRRLCDLLGGRRTPHAFLLDGKDVLRYSGAVDDDFTEELDAATRHSWLKDAVQAVLGGKSVAVAETKPEGCSIKR